ncbi:hypothetical protein FA15DRAFT_603874 [Coprinopsis marcescibilis]|uniref:Telomerase reverse transcriptase C-terminal extension domain-containing protein n=1 Tax=Coprinopsis marcescibilis TaxID=230819 RepID=A0A5C3KEH3_COPMA|nr:hypothetical protein FA15DRAFT_603874 [Coprinopsis marcescibilis]
MKMNEYIREGGLKVKGNPAFLFKTIQNTIEFSYSSIISQASRKTKNNRNQVSWSPKKLAVLWLGSHAFHHVLSKKPREYAAILRTLDKNLCRFSNRAYKKRFKRLVKEGQSAFNHTNV